MQEKVLFSDEELHLLTNKDVFIIKNNVTDKLRHLFNDLNEQLEKEIAILSNLLPAEAVATKGKISRGENYSGFPWMVLDNPRVFNKDHVFAYRTMCWWGHEFSFTLHLSGIYLDAIRDHLTEKLGSISDKDIYICVNDTPWTYHFESGNYQLLAEELKKMNGAYTRNFIKLSRKLTITEASMKQHAIETFHIFVKALF